MLFEQKNLSAVLLKRLGKETLVLTVDLKIKICSKTGVHNCGPDENCFKSLNVEGPLVAPRACFAASCFYRLQKYFEIK